MTRVYEKCHSAYKSASIAMVITSKKVRPSHQCNLLIANKCIFYVEKNWRPYFADMLRTFKTEQYDTVRFSQKICEGKKIFFNFLSVA